MKNSRPEAQRGNMFDTGHNSVPSHQCQSQFLPRRFDWKYNFGVYTAHSRQHCRKFSKDFLAVLKSHFIEIFKFDDVFVVMLPFNSIVNYYVKLRYVMRYSSAKNMSFDMSLRCKNKYFFAERMRECVTSFIEWMPVCSIDRSIDWLMTIFRHLYFFNAAWFVGPYRWSKNRLLKVLKARQISPPPPVPIVKSTYKCPGPSIWTRTKSNPPPTRTPYREFRRDSSKSSPAAPTPSTIFPVTTPSSTTKKSSQSGPTQPVQNYRPRHGRPFPRPSPRWNAIWTRWNTRRLVEFWRVSESRGRKIVPLWRWRWTVSRIRRNGIKWLCCWAVTFRQNFAENLMHFWRRKEFWSPLSNLFRFLWLFFSCLSRTSPPVPLWHRITPFLYEKIRFCQRESDKVKQLSKIFHFEPFQK